MKASIAQVAFIAAVVGAAALCHSRKAKRAEHALSCEGGAAGSTERASTNVMNNAYLVQNILDFVGPGQHLYVSTISQLVHRCYSTVPAIEFDGYDTNGKEKTMLISSQMTRYSETIACISRFRLALASGVELAVHRSMLKCLAYCQMLSKYTAASPHRTRTGVLVFDILHWRFQMLVGDQEMLTFVHEKLGMPWTEHVINGAIVSGNIALLQWLYADMKCPLSGNSSSMAVRYRHPDILKWLHRNGHKFHCRTFAIAARFSYIDMMQCLLELGHIPDTETCTAAFVGDAVKSLQWLYEHECPWDVALLACQAAANASINGMDWLVQQHGETILDAVVMATAADNGKLAMCQHLRSIGCVWDESACYTAASKGHVDVLTWLRDNGCPHEDVALMATAAHGGSTAVMQYIIDHHVMQHQLTAGEVLTFMLLFAGFSDKLAAAQWLREQGAEWPSGLSTIDDDGTVLEWSGEVLVWARATGCASPMTIQQQ
jgi:hypothetical protein